MSAWQPIETAPIKPFDEANWYISHSPYLLLWTESGAVIGSYSFTTKKGKGRWRTWGGTIVPTHWMPLPAAPVAITKLEAKQ